MGNAWGSRLDAWYVYNFAVQGMLTHYAGKIAAFELVGGSSRLVSG